MIFRHEAVGKLYPNLVTTVGDKSYDSSGNLIVVDETKVAEENAKLEAEWKSKQYQRDREREYPDLQECIHAILDDDLTALQAKRKLVKEKFPKP